MGLRSVLQEVHSVFNFLTNVWSALPNMVKLLIYVSFGLAIFIAVLRSLWG